MVTQCQARYVSGKSSIMKKKREKMNTRENIFLAKEIQHNSEPNLMEASCSHVLFVTIMELFT